MTNFDKALIYTMKNEGFYSDDKFDSGGATMMGITIGDLARWRKTKVTKQDVKNLSQEEASQIYKKWYWDSMCLDQVKQECISTALFDIGVVRGIGVPPKYAQQICCNHGEDLVIDGMVGPKTIAAINRMDPAAFVLEFHDKAAAGFRAIVARNETQRKFLKGWLRRADRLLTLI